MFQFNALPVFTFRLRVLMVKPPTPFLFHIFNLYETRRQSRNLRLIVLFLYRHVRQHFNLVNKTVAPTSHGTGILLILVFSWYYRSVVRSTFKILRLISKIGIIKVGLGYFNIFWDVLFKVGLSLIH